MTSPRRSHSGVWCLSTSAATTAPTTKQPERLIVNVLHGKSPNARASIERSTR